VTAGDTCKEGEGADDEGCEVHVGALGIFGGLKIDRAIGLSSSGACFCFMDGSAYEATIPQESMGTLYLCSRIR